VYGQVWSAHTQVWLSNLVLKGPLTWGGSGYKKPVAVGVSALFGFKWSGCMPVMANRAGRTKRRKGVGATATPSTVRLTPPSWKVAEDAAAALGVSRDAYLDRLLAREAAHADDAGRPEWWDEPVPSDQTILPLDLEREKSLQNA
jgi:hypothetical protein